MLTRWILRTTSLSEASVEYEYRTARYEFKYEEGPEQRNRLESPIGSSLLENHPRQLW
jgi:hypothetical protein